MSTKADKLVGGAIKGARERASLTIEQTSRIVGASVVTLEAIEQGESRASPQMLEALAAAFDVKMSEFLQAALEKPEAADSKKSAERPLPGAKDRR